MSFSYNNTQIVASGTNYISFVRFTIDDKNSASYILEDEEITAIYNDITTLYSGESQTIRNWRTAVAAKEYVCRSYSSTITSWSSDGTSINYGNRATTCQDELNRLRYKLLSVIGQPAILYPTRPASFCE